MMHDFLRNTSKIFASALKNQTNVVVLFQSNDTASYYREPDWLQLLQKEEAAHSVRPSAVAYCSRTRTAVSAAEDGVR